LPTSNLPLKMSNLPNKDFGTAVNHF